MSSNEEKQNDALLKASTSEATSTKEATSNETEATSTTVMRANSDTTEVTTNTKNSSSSSGTSTSTVHKKRKANEFDNDCNGNGHGNGHGNSNDQDDSDHDGSNSNNTSSSNSGSSSLWQVSKKRLKATITGLFRWTSENNVNTDVNADADVDLDANVSSKTTSAESASTAKNTPTPSKILSSKGCIAQTLTVSDQHATLLLTTPAPTTTATTGTTAESENGTTATTATTTKTIQSILKLQLIPFHREILGSNPVIDPQKQQQNGEDNGIKPELKLLDNKPIASDQIISFLQSYNYNLKSESGAEYSYYDAALNSSTSTSNSASNSASNSFNVELISPASERQIKRSLPTHQTALIEETSTIYNKVVSPYIQNIIENGSINWIHNIINGKKEQERLLVNHESYIINIDTKWRSHPNAFDVPKKDWYQHKSVNDLYCLGIFKKLEPNVASIRDLTMDHVPILKSMKEKGLQMIEEIYGVASNQIRVFVHYHPQFYHFHVHFTRIHNDIGCQVERGHLVSDIIQNLELDSEYYAKRTITYKLKVSSPLYLLIQQRQKEMEKEEEEEGETNDKDDNEKEEGKVDEQNNEDKELEKPESGQDNWV